VKKVFYWIYVLLTFAVAIYAIISVNTVLDQPIEREIGPHKIVNLEYPNFSITGNIVIKSEEAFMIVTTSGQLLPQPTYNEAKPGETSGVFELSTPMDGRYSASYTKAVSLYTLEESKITFYRSEGKILWNRISTFLFFLIIWLWLAHQVHKLVK